MESEILQEDELLIIYPSIMILDVPNCDVIGHPPNIKIHQLNITKLSTQIKKLLLFFISFSNDLFYFRLSFFDYLWLAVHLQFS